MNRTGVLYRITGVIGSFVIYLPILAGILAAMWYYLPLWYLSWYVVTFIFPIQYWDGHWNPVLDYATGTVNWSLAISIWITESLIFCLGIVLFLYGLKTMVIHRAKDDGLVTTGPYRWIRHPQHLGIILFLLSPALLPIQPLRPELIYIRPSDILSWSLIAFALVVGADLEEVSLSRRFGEGYDAYRSAVPFMVPFLRSLPYFSEMKILGQGRPARYILWFAVYWSIGTLMLYLFSFLPLMYWL